MIKCGIYIITNTINGKVYIGQSINIIKRFNAHKRVESNIYLKRAYMKHGIGAFTFEILEELPNNQAVLDEREIYYINKYNALNYKHGYNNKEGGKSGRHTEETKKKISEIGKTRPPASEATRKKLSEANKGHPFYGRKRMSEETKEKMRISQRKRRENTEITEEFRKKMSEIRLRSKILNFTGEDYRRKR